MWPYDTPVSEDSMGYRLREERLRLGFDEQGFCQALGITPERLRALETESFEEPAGSGELAGMAGQGVDVQYLLVGQRARALSAEEQALIERYRVVTDEQQKHLKAVGDAAA